MRAQWKIKIRRIINSFTFLCIDTARMLPILDVIYIRLECFMKKKKLLWLRGESIKSYCEKKGEEIIEIERECKREVYIPAFFELSVAEKHYFVSPSIYVSCLHDVTVVGGTGVIMTDECLLYDAFKRDEDHRMMFRCGPLKRGGKSRLLIAVEPEEREIDRAINLCGFASNNYYHLTMEMLSRLDYLNQVWDSKEYPLLINEEIKKIPQFMQLLKTIKGNREVVYVPSYMQLRVGCLLQPSMNTWMPMNVKRRRDFRLSDNLIAKSGIFNIRSHVKKYMEEQSDLKIYISRKNANLVRIVNEKRILPLFRDAGYQIVCTEELT